MSVIASYLDSIGDESQRDRLEEIFVWIQETYPQLEPVIKWNQPMYTDHGTFIIGFSTAKNHFSFTPEEQTMPLFVREIEALGYEHTKGIVKIKWTQEVNYELIGKMIDYNIAEKKDCTTFFRKK